MKVALLAIVAGAGLLAACASTSPPDRSFVRGETVASETDEAVCRAHAVVASRQEPNTVRINQTAIARTDVRVNSPTFNSGFQQPTMADYGEIGENLGTALAGIRARSERSKRRAEIFDAVMTACMVSNGWQIGSEDQE